MLSKNYKKAEAVHSSKELDKKILSNPSKALIGR